MLWTNPVLVASFLALDHLVQVQVFLFFLASGWEDGGGIPLLKGQLNASFMGVGGLSFPFLTSGGEDGGGIPLLKGQLNASFMADGVGGLSFPFLISGGDDGGGIPLVLVVSLFLF